MKSQIIERLGHTDILLPSQIAAGLLANDRVKVRLSVLQAAARRARNSGETLFELGTECRAADIDPFAMESLVNHAGLAADDRLTAPGLDALVLAIWNDLAAMVEAVEAGDPSAGKTARGRLAAIRQRTGWQPGDGLALEHVSALTGLSAGDDDSLHRLVMDLHKALNRLSVAHAEEVVHGAHVYGLLAEDRPLVEAFMRGLASTSKLKFGHPGLGTTATRSGTRLTIQNDIGETDAHVVVIAVDPDAITVTYTDIHLARARFFTGLLRGFAVEWSGLDRQRAEGLGDEEVFYLVSGRYAAAGREAFLETIGASLVFLIDWNKARKLLRTWVSKGDAVRILEWAARNRVGHRGFLELGGGELVASAVHHAAATRIGFGEQLEHALGRDGAVEFLRAVLRVSAEALLEGSSPRLARDRIEAELVRHLQRVDTALLAIVLRQAGLAREIATGIAALLAPSHDRIDAREKLADRARRIEEKADRIALDARREIAHLDADRSIEQLVNTLEEVIDELEQAAFVASLVPDEAPSELRTPLAELCAAAIAGTEAAASGTAAAADVPEGRRVDSEDALSAVGRLLDAEHAADSAERSITRIVLSGICDLRTSLSVLDLARALERATDRLASFGHLLRGRVLAELSA